MNHAMTLVPRVAWRAAPPERFALDPRVVALLEGIRREGTLRAAIADAALSYRAAWGLLAAAAESLGAPLAELERGRGARLAPLGLRLLDGEAAARAALAGAQVRIELAPARARNVGAKPPSRLRIAASHDLALAALRELWVAEGALAVELDTRGSVESLASLRRGEATLAGFHVAADGLGAGELIRRLDPRRDVLVRFVHRRQGLIVPRGNPRRLRTLADIAGRRLRFVNRQRGSGTRLLVDQLLRTQHVDPAAVRGYATEEFTHLAVAATVAAGKADAGFGLEAAARQFGLAFVPVVEERYLFACRRAALRHSLVQRLRDLLGSPATARTIGRLAGYTLDRPGQLLEPRELQVLAVAGVRSS
jgi:putative molybdopterin biosynthesis protein